MVLGQLPVPGRSTNLERVGQGSSVLAVGADGVFLDIFSLVYHFSFSLSLIVSDDNRARAYCACSRCGWGLFGHFYSPLFFPSSFSLSL